VGDNFQDNRDQQKASANASAEAQAPTAPASEVIEESTARDQEAASTPKASAKVPASEPRSETPSVQDHPSEDTASTSPTTPSSVHPPQAPAAATSTPSTTVKPATRPAVPAIPVIPAVPALPKASPKTAKAPATATEKTTGETKPAAPVESKPAVEETSVKEVNGTTQESTDASKKDPAPTPAPPKLPAWSKPRSWATHLKGPAASSGAATAASAQAQANGDGNSDASSLAPGATFVKANANSIAEAIQSYRVGGAQKLAFLEPRGLINTGNMCYMNSILQVLIFCVPFYDFLDQVSKKAAHSFKSETPLIDAMIMFMREFKVIDSAVSVDQLRRRLKNDELEQYGEAFTPEFVYEAMRKLDRFKSMQRGHQQDAEEFLGFLLESLNDECAHVMRSAMPASTAASTAPSSTIPSPTSSKAEGGDDWLEVGPRQRAAITRSSGHSSAPSPITKIFGGQLRSEFRVPGKQISVTLEPYQPLQLDIGAPEVRNIVDALRGLTRQETLHGDFNSPHGKDTKATKQVTIDQLPPVLILHLKRFQFNAEVGNTVKIWKKVGYPLELEIPKEVVSRQKWNTTFAENPNLLKYRLTMVVYHHGKNASGGHYTVDVRRQDGREWIRIDDTIIRRVRSEDVAEGGEEEDFGKVTTGDKKQNGVASNRFGAMSMSDDEDAAAEHEGEWKQAVSGGKQKYSTVANGASTPTTNGFKAKQHKESIKDNKVAYLLFYQRI